MPGTISAWGSVMSIQRGPGSQPGERAAAVGTQGSPEWREAGKGPATSWLLVTSNQPPASSSPAGAGGEWSEWGRPVPSSLPKGGQGVTVAVSFLADDASCQNLG